MRLVNWVQTASVNIICNCEGLGASLIGPRARQGYRLSYLYPALCCEASQSNKARRGNRRAKVGKNQSYLLSDDFIFKIENPKRCLEGLI